MPKKEFTRPPFTLIHYADTAGCGYHRMIHPFETLAQNALINGRAEMRLMSDHEIQAMKPDVIVMQRQHEKVQIERMKAYRQFAPEACIIYEIDDALSLVPDWSYHKSFLPPNVDASMREAIEQCDIVTVSTHALKNHIAKILNHTKKEIRVVPNMLSGQDFDFCDMISSKSEKLNIKPRIGWHGGISHDGDLALIAEAVDATADIVEWVFFGMKPNCKTQVEFHEGVGVRDYLGHLASFNLDCLLAPLEANGFNLCKSNLRLIEAGACGYPVIASPFGPYLENNPPVFYAENGDWTDVIRDFVALPLTERKAKGKALREWARRNYCMEGENLEKRRDAWMPRNTKAFVPNMKSSGGNGLVVVAPQEIDFLKDYAVHVETFAQAEKLQGDILYVRMDCTLDLEMINRLRKRLANPMVASVTPMGNDGGPNAFPVPGRYQEIDANSGDKINDLVTTLFAYKSEEIIAPHSPVVLISRRALDMIGYFSSDFTTAEETIAEWSIMAMAKGLKNLLAMDCFTASLMSPPLSSNQNLSGRVATCWTHIAKIPEDKTPPYRSTLELEWHRLYHKNPVPYQKEMSYSGWAAIFDTPGDKDKEAIKEAIALMPLIPSFKIAGLDGDVNMLNVIYPETYKNDPTAEWTFFAQAGAMITPHALYMFAVALIENPDAEVVYGDNDILSPDSVRVEHDFKPLKFDYDLFLCRDYVTPICAVRTDRVDHTQESLYRYLLTVHEDKFVHIPRVLAHLKPSTPDREFKCRDARIRAINEELGQYIRAIPHPAFLGYVLPEWCLPESAPKVTIIIPTKNKIDQIAPCLSTIFKITEYPNYEVLVVDNGSTNEDVLSYLADIVKREPRVRVLRYDERFNWAAINNWAVLHTSQDTNYLLFLNDDTRVVEAQWLSCMVTTSLYRDKAAVVGARLLYPMGAIQHVGVMCDYGNAGHIHKMLPANHPGYNGLAALTHQATAVTGACMMVRRNVFAKLGGFDEKYAMNFNDVAFCLKANEAGYVCVVAANAQLQHLESVTRGPVGPELYSEAKMLRDEFKIPDRYWNRNIIFKHTENGTQIIGGSHMEMLRWPPDAWPWRNSEWEQRGVLMIGDDGLQGMKEAREGNIVYQASLNGYTLGIVLPALNNVAAWDIRKAEQASSDLMKLGIDRIIVCSMPLGSQALLGFLSRLGIKLEYRPGNAEIICPFGNFTPNGHACDNGWKKGECQACVDDHSSPFGYINIDSWRADWLPLLSQAEINTSRLNQTYIEALGFGGEDAG